MHFIQIFATFVFINILNVSNLFNTLVECRLATLFTMTSMLCRKQLGGIVGVQNENKVEELIIDGEDHIQTMVSVSLVETKFHIWSTKRNLRATPTKFVASKNIKVI